MKKILITFIFGALIGPLAAYTSTNVAGQTGLIATPTARINWEGNNSGAAITAGYNYFNNGAGYQFLAVLYSGAGLPGGYLRSRFFWHGSRHLGRDR